MVLLHPQPDASNRYLPQYTRRLNSFCSEYIQRTLAQEASREYSRRSLQATQEAFKTALSNLFISGTAIVGWKTSPATLKRQCLQIWRRRESWTQYLIAESTAGLDQSLSWAHSPSNLSHYCSPRPQSGELSKHAWRRQLINGIYLLKSKDSHLQKWASHGRSFRLDRHSKTRVIAVKTAVVNKKPVWRTKKTIALEQSLEIGTSLQVRNITHALNFAVMMPCSKSLGKHQP